MGTSESIYAGEARINVADYIKNPLELRATLEARGAFRFVPFKSGLFPASNISEELGKLTEMNMGWLRDNAFIGDTLYEDGQLDLAVPVAVAMIKILDANMDIIDGVVSGRDRSRRIPVRYVGDTLERDPENRIQNDSVGYALWFTTKLLKAGVIVPTEGIQNIIAQTTRYLAAIEYWHDFDQGHWEEDDRIHTTSIGAVIAGIRGAQALFQKTGYQTEIEFAKLIDRGLDTINLMHAYGLSSISQKESQLFQAMKNPKIIGFSDPRVFHDFLSSFSLHRRQHDSAELFLIEPLGVITGEKARRIYSDNEKYLERSKGTGRYIGDSYWGDRNFDKEMSITDRTRSAPGRLDWRNQKAAQIAHNQTEARWTLFDPIKSEIAGTWYTETYDPDYLDKHFEKLNRTLELLTETEDGELHWTENFYLADRRVGDTDLWESMWLPNPHSPLLWTQANSLRMVNTFERVVALAKLLGHIKESHKIISFA